MINSILFCLLGHTGGIFIENENEFIVNENISSLTKSEIESLQIICEIGFKYKILYDISTQYETIYNNNILNLTNLNNENNNNNNESVYLSGICQTIFDLLSEYRTVIENLESKFYLEQNLTINEIVTEVHSYYIKFNKLYEFIQHIYNNKLKGGYLLNYIYECGINGDLNAKEIFKNLFINCNIILNNLISNWIINNNIQSNEFFIETSNNYNFINDENFLNKNNNNNKNFYTYENEDLESWNANFYINKDNVPIYFPNNLAEDILFIGKAIKILNSNKNSEESKISFNDMSIFYTSLQKLNEIIFKQNSDINNLIDIELYNKIITLIKNCVSKFLWKLVVDKYDFIKHLNAVKNIFLTYHGEFFYNFIIKIKELLNSPNFNKQIENEINDVYWKTSLKEVFHIDFNQENFNIYNGFKIKLISSGFSLNFQNEKYLKDYLDKKEINYLGGFNFDRISSTFRLLNTTHNSTNGAIWNTSFYDLDEEFLMNSNFILKNFTKKENENNNYSYIENINTNILENSVIKKNNRLSLNDNYNNNEHLNRKIYINYVLHIFKNFPNQPPLNLSELINYFNFQFILNYEDNNLPNLLTSINFNLTYQNLSKNINKNIYSINFTNDPFNNDNNNNNSNNINDLISSSNELNSIIISFKNNYCSIYNEKKTFIFNFPFIINSFIPKDKRKMIIGMLIQSENVDMIFENISWNCNFYSGEIYNENSNLILINYNPPWPQNFIFNENVLKNYNIIFNLIFPLKTSSTMLNNIWVKKKNICNKYYNNIFKIIDSIHAQLTSFIQNLISFYMFDVIEVKFKTFFEKIKKCNNLDDLMKFHEEFLNEVITNSFVNSKRIMRMIFDILYVIRKYTNYVQNLLKNINENLILNSKNVENEIIIDDEEKKIQDLIFIENEFKSKVQLLINSFTKIKITKHFNIISQLLTKIESDNIKNFNNNNINDMN